MLKVANSVINASQITGVLPVVNGGTNASTASITSFNNITGYSASGATGTTTTNLVFSTSPSITTPTLVGNATLSTGNLVVSSGKGIDFSATPGTGTSELFADYEEGTWAIADASAAGLVLTVSNATYTKIGRAVFVQFYVTYPVTASAAQAALTLPYTAVNYGQLCGRFGAAVTGVWQCQDGSVNTILNSINGGAAITNASLSAQYVIISGVYQAT